MIPREKYDIKDEDFAVKFSTLGLFFPAYKDVAINGLKITNAPRQLKFVVDRKSERKSPFHKGQSLVFTKLQHPDGTPFSGCPRTLLEKAIRELKAFGGYEVKAGMEIEFTLLDMKTKEPVEQGLDTNIHTLATYMEDFDEIYNTLYNHDIYIEAIHKECGAGQYEMVIHYGELQKILDDFYIAKEVIA